MSEKITIIIGATSVGVILSIVVGTFWYQPIYNEKCIDEDGKVTGFLRCTITYEDFDSEKDMYYEMHDVVAHVELRAYSFEDEETYMMVSIVEFLKNPKNASHLTIWGNFNEFKDYCSPPNNCSQAIAYLYEDKNGIYHKGDYWEWLDVDKPTVTDKIIECYKIFHCDSSIDSSFATCVDSKRDGITIKEICADPNAITIENGCVRMNLSENMTLVSCS